MHSGYSAKCSLVMALSAPGSELLEALIAFPEAVGIWAIQAGIACHGPLLVTAHLGLRPVATGASRCGVAGL
jgi:hypothetical protein